MVELQQLLLLQAQLVGEHGDIQHDEQDVDEGIFLRAHAVSQGDHEHNSF